MNHFNINKLLKGKSPINITIDKQARAIYFKVTDQEVQRTERINSTLSVDYGKNDSVVGVEIIRLSKIEVILKKALKDIYATLPAKAMATA